MNINIMSSAKNISTFEYQNVSTYVDIDYSTQPPLTAEELATQNDQRTANLWNGVGKLLKVTFNTVTKRWLGSRKIKVIHEKPPKYELVHIVGPNNPDDFDKINKAYQDSGLQYLVIGNGTQLITDEALASLFEQVSFRARINIYAHGIINAHKEHQIELSDHLTRTYQLFKTLTLVLSERFEGTIHLLSCYGGAAAIAKPYLPKKSTLWTHASGEYITINPFSAKMIIDGITNYPNRITESLLLCPETITLNREDEQLCTLNPPETLLYFSKDLKQHLKKENQKCHNAELTTAINSLHISDEQFELYQTELFILQSARGNTAYVKSYLTNTEIDPDAIIAQNVTAFYLAASQGRDDIIELFLKDPRVNPNRPTTQESTAFLIAAQNGRYKVVKRLLNDPRINPNQVGKQGSAIFLAAQLGRDQTVEVLLNDSRIDPNLVLNNGPTALYMAAQNGHYTTIEKLLKLSKTDPNIAELDGATPLQIAVQYDRIEVVELLLKHPKIDPNAATTQVDTPLYFATFHNKEKIVVLLLSHPEIDPNLKNENKLTPLILATYNNLVEIIQQLINHSKIDPNVTYNGSTALNIAIKNNSTEAVKQILNHPKTNINLPDSGNATVLLKASVWGLDKIVKLLLEDPRLNLSLHGEICIILARQKGFNDIADIIQEEMKKRGLLV